jgi:hypothetical protein
VVVDVWDVHPDFWAHRKGVDYARLYSRARWLADVLGTLASSELAPEGLRLAVELYGAGYAVLADGTAIAWVGADPDDAELWAEVAADGTGVVSAGGLLVAA